MTDNHNDPYKPLVRWSGIPIPQWRIITMILINFSYLMIMTIMITYIKMTDYHNDHIQLNCNKYWLSKCDMIYWRSWTHNYPIPFLDTVWIIPFWPLLRQMWNLLVTHPHFLLNHPSSSWREYICSNTQRSAVGFWRVLCKKEPRLRI